MTREELINEVQTIQPTLGGWTSTEKATLLATTIYDNQLTNGLEVGVYCGGSAIPAGLAFRALGRGCLLCVDPWSPAASVVGQDQVNADWWSKLDHEAIHDEFQSKLVTHKLQGTVVKTYRKTNREVYPMINKLTFAYINIDGNHSPEEAVWDVEHYVPLLTSGGFFWFDDCVWQGQSNAYDLLKSMQDMEEVAKVDTGALFRKK